MTVTLTLRQAADAPKQWRFEAGDAVAVQRLLPDIDDYRTDPDSDEAVLVAERDGEPLGTWTKAGAARLGSLVSRELAGPEWTDVRSTLQEAVMDRTPAE